MIRFLPSIGGLLFVSCLLFGGEIPNSATLNKIYSNTNYDYSNASGISVLNGVSVPSDFPFLSPSILEEGIASGRLFLNNWNGTPYILILNNDGSPYFYQKVENRSRDFKLQHNGMLTRRFFNDTSNGFYVMDSSYTVVDTLMAVNGYGTDEHELYMLENGSYFLIAQGYRQVRMDTIVEGGDPNATVIDNHIQEFDAEHNLVFEWLSHEHFNIQDAVHINLGGSWLDYVHMNSIAVDYDGNIIISSRHQSEVTKINRQTGEIIWRLGGVNNDFNLVNDEYEISYQHHARPVPGKPGHYTIFDNGNYRNPSFTRVVEYQIDTLAMTATKVWEYRHSPDRFTGWMGNAQRLTNGNTLINWADQSLPKFTEVTPDGNVVYEADFVSPANSYRTFRFAWENPTTTPYLLVEAYPDKVSLIFNLFGVTNVEKYIVYYGTQPDQLIALDTVSTPYFVTSELENNETYYFEVMAIDSLGNESDRSNREEVFTRFVQPGENYILNGDFEYGDQNWHLSSFGSAISDLIIEQGVAHIKINDPGSEVWHVQMVQGNIPLINGRKYRLEFEAWSDTSRLINPPIERNGPNWENYSQQGPIVLTTSRKNYIHDFTMEHETDYQARLTLNMGFSSGDVFLDNFSLVEMTATSIDNENLLPEIFRLDQNYPNPFNPSTVISFLVGEHSQVELTVYNTIGQKIRTLLNAYIAPGTHKVSWDGRDEIGRMVGSGLYFYQIKTPSFVKTKKMHLLK